ncbi:hypothetical protein [Streptomyces sp. NPDC058572]|uniref:hypothetical protein n=1 Tax=Streptomyces sp. NPDC058572 TaxID=3346546 RepID=UPI0036648404
MTHDFGFHLTQELGNYGSPTVSWPASAEHVAPFHTLGTDRAAQWLVAARRAHLHVVAADNARDYQFCFAAHLDTEIGDDRGPSLDHTAAWVAMKALYELTRRDAGADAAVFFDCALPACERSSGRPGTRPVAAAASA